MKSLIAIVLALVMIMPVTLTQDFSIKTSQHIQNMEKMVSNAKNEIHSYKSYNFKILDDQFGAFVYTKCNGIEKKTPILKALLNGIDVDNNPNTGEGGKDVKINAFIFPFVNQQNGKWILAISLVFKIIRLGNEIKDSDFESYVQLNLQGDTYRVGMGSSYGQAIPKEARIVFTIVPYLMYNREPEYYLNLEPVFEGNPSNVSIFGEYIGKTHQYIQLDFKPAVTTIIKFAPSVKIGHAGISIERDASQETTLRMIYKGKFNANLTIEDVPMLMSFNLSISQNHFEYNSNDEFNVSMIVEGNHEACALIKYLPRHIAIDGGVNGYVSVYINNRKTELILSNRIENPTTFLKVSNLTGNISFAWKIGLNGSIAIDGGKNASMELYALDGIFDLKGIKKAEHFMFSWNLSVNGSIAIDTNWEWLASYSLRFILGNFGIEINASFIRADGYILQWTPSLPVFNSSGSIDFIGDIDFSIMINGIWYHLF